MKLRSPLLALPVAAALVLAGCGSGSEDTATETGESGGAIAASGSSGDFAGSYVSSLNQIADALEDVEDESSARVAAQEIAAANQDLQALVEEMDSMTDAARGMALATRMSELTQVQMRVGTAVQRIASSNPQLFSIISEEIRRMPQIGN